MAEHLATGNYDQLHHLIADGVWDATPLASELLDQADLLVGDDDAVLVIDDTAMPSIEGPAIAYPDLHRRWSRAMFWSWTSGRKRDPEPGGGA